jgi:hypothetical protein
MFDVLHRGQGNFLQAKRVKFFWTVFIGICKTSNSLRSTKYKYTQSFGNGSQSTSPLCSPGSPFSAWRGRTPRGSLVFLAALPGTKVCFELTAFHAHNVTTTIGLGLFSLCFDWNYVGGGGSAYGPLFQPLATQLSLFAGVFICMLVSCACCP